MPRQPRKESSTNRQILRRLDNIASPIFILSSNCSPLYANVAAHRRLSDAAVSDISTFIDGNVRTQLKQLSKHHMPRLLLSDKYLPGLQSAVAGIFDFEDEQLIILVFASIFSLIPGQIDKISSEQFASVFWDKFCVEIGHMISNDQKTDRRSIENSIRRTNVFDKMSCESSAYLERSTESYIQNVEEIKTFIRYIDKYLLDVAKRFRFEILFKSDNFTVSYDHDKYVDCLGYLVCFVSVSLMMLGISKDYSLNIALNSFKDGNGFATSFDTMLSNDIDIDDGAVDIQTLCSYFPSAIPSLLCIDIACDYFSYGDSVEVRTLNGDKHATFSLSIEFVSSDILRFNMNELTFDIKFSRILGVFDQILADLDGSDGEI